MLLTTKLRNQIRKNTNIPLEFYVRNIAINRQKRGCSGHIVNTDTKVTVYINTEEVTLSSLKGHCMCRYARDIKDYSSHNLGAIGRNRWYKESDFPKAIAQMLETPREQIR